MSNTNNKIYLIDAMGLAFRAFYAIRTALTDSRGRPTNAVYGFARILLKILREHDPSHLAVVFDAPGKTFRDAMYEAYKATRTETPEELTAQFPIMQDMVQALGLPLFVVPGVEADDVMGTLACEAAAAGIEAVLVTGDKDMMQLIRPGVKCFDPSKGDNGVWLDEAAVFERFGTDPAHVVDALALIGDTADNIPGVKGIGEKTAQKLMAQYHSLEGLYEHIDELKGKQKENLLEGKEQAFFSRQLATIKCDVELERTVADCLRQPFDRNATIDCLTGLGFHRLVEEYLGQIPEDNQEPAGNSDCHYNLVTTYEELDAALEAMRAAGAFAIDTETTSTDPMRAKLVGISISREARHGFYIPVGHLPEACHFMTDPDDLTTAVEYQQLPMDEVLARLKPLLEDETLGKIGHNIKYDLVVFARHGLQMRGIVMDTMVGSYLTDPSRLRHNLDEVSLQYLRRSLTPISGLIGKGAKAVTFDHVPLDRATGYACEDADAAWQLSDIFSRQMLERELRPLFEEIELPLISVLAKMEMAGIALDLSVFDALRTEMEKRLAELEQEIFDCAGRPFKINSPKQLQEVLFDELKLKPIRKTQTGYSTDVDVLEVLAGQHPLPEKVLEFRTLEKLRGAYVDALPRLIHPETGRIHTSFNQAVAATGRLSSSDPNLQNIPVRNDYGRRIRQGFVAGEPKHVLISADYSQIELRILAHLSGDAALSEAFFSDEDIHRDTASRVFGVSPGEVTSDMRRQAKAVNFGVVYGISAFGLGRNLGISNSEADKFIKAYFAQYPGVRKWLDSTIKEAHETGYVKTMLNRRRYVPDLGSKNMAVRRAAERAAINTPVQGSAADIIKRAMVQLDAALEGTGAQLLLQVHDELVIEAPEEKAKEVAETTRRVMENAVTLNVPLKVDVGIGNNWAEIH
jgi:DNA polymerase-1